MILNVPVDILEQFILGDVNPDPTNNDFCTATPPKVVIQPPDVKLVTSDVDNIDILPFNNNEAFVDVLTEVSDIIILLI